MDYTLDLDPGSLLVSMGDVVLGPGAGLVLPIGVYLVACPDVTLALGRVLAVDPVTCAVSCVDPELDVRRSALPIRANAQALGPLQLSASAVPVRAGASYGG